MRNINFGSKHNEIDSSLNRVQISWELAPA